MNKHLAAVSLSVVLLLAPVVSGRYVLRAARQQTPAAKTAAPLHLAGLRDRVTVRRDERGIPYIEAANEDDLYFVQGYVTASDRLWQMDLLRRTARGELSEIFGNRTLEEDKRRRIYGFGALADGMLARSSTRTRAVLEAYAQGVNAFIASLNKETLPPEFLILQYQPRPWQPSDSLVIGKNFAEVLARPWSADILRAALDDLPPERREALLPETSPLDVLVVGSDPGNTNKKRPAALPRADYPPPIADAPGTLRALSQLTETMRRSFERIGLYAEDHAASNNWVVAGRRTASGKPLLANDPHLSPGAPPIWYMTHLRAPGIEVAGVTAPGAPGIILGHNAHIAWGATNLGPDVQDVYIEKFDPANPRRYMTPGGWREAEVRREAIKVRKSFADMTSETVTLDVTVTRHGPIVFEKDGRRYALRWTSLDPQAVEFEAFHSINRARNWDEFRAALKQYEGPTQNFIYADVNGHIGYYGAGRIPLRKSGDGSLPLDGATDAGEWVGFIPFEGLPHSYDPPSGIIVTANSRIVGRDYPYHLAHEWAEPYRARRIYDLLSTREKLTADDFRRVQGDTYSIGAALFARELLKIAPEMTALAPADDKWRATLRLLEEWDGRIAADSHAALLVGEMRDAFRNRVLAAAIGPARAKAYRWTNRGTFIDRLITERPPEWLPKEFKSYAELLRASHTDARQALTARLGADDSQWTWGRSSQVRFPHPLAAVPLIGLQFTIAPFPQNGSASSLATVNVGAYVSMRLIADTSDWDKTQQGIAPGQSGNPADQHWKDQIADWRDVTPRVFPFTSGAVAAATKEIIMLAPVTKLNSTAQTTTNLPDAHIPTVTVGLSVEGSKYDGF